MKTSSEVITDLLKAGFSFRPTMHKKDAVEILHDGKWWGMYNREERMIIMPVIRTRLRNIGYDEIDLQIVRDAIISFAHYNAT